MSDKDNNIYYDYPSQCYFTFFTQEPLNCYICHQPFIPTFYPNCQIFCQSCFSKYLNSYSEHQIQSAQPPKPPQQALPVPTPVLTPKIHPPQTFKFPQHLMHGLIFACDFVSHFSDLIKVECFNIEQLYNSLTGESSEEVFKELCKSLSLKLAESVLRQDSEFKVTEKSKIFYMGSKLFEILDIRKCMDVVWTSLLGELIQGKFYNEYVKGTAVEKIKKNMNGSLVDEDLRGLCIEEKLGIIEFLINSYLDSKECHEFIAEKVEHQVNLTKIRFEKKQRIKQIENELMISTEPKPTLEKEKEELVLEEEKIREELALVFYRTVPIGTDAHNNEYFHFAFEQDKLMVLYPSANPVNELGIWYFYGNKESILKLQGELVQQNKKELKLKQSLEKVIKTTLREATEPEAYTNTKSAFKSHELSIDNIKENLKATEKTFTKYLKSTKKRWEIEQNEKKWKASLFTNTELHEIVELLLEFSEKSMSPLRFQLIPKQKKGKYRKVLLKLWQNSQEGCIAWEDFVKSCRSNEQLSFAVDIYSQVINSYIIRKKEETSKHSDECYKCKDGGKLIMCENCPRVAHLKCSGLVKIPRGEWLCEFCK